ncbi:hypothetical protein F6Y05_01655 (plasmid) [Bacillus megaterium]|nr:hypothetical protein [Priestia megaterium]NGY85190.1 hypothetical protein [Priestia megaterium]
MKNEEILKKLHEFADYLDKGNIASYLLRKIGWGIIQVLSFLVDSLEGITDKVLGIKLFLIHLRFKISLKRSSRFSISCGHFPSCISVIC